MIKKNVIAYLFSLFFIIGISLFMSQATYAANIGDVLETEESGWKRFSDYDSNISYIGNWKDWSSEIFVNGTAHWAEGETNTCRFNFTGTKIRIISETVYHNSANIHVKIDGVEVDTFSEYSPSQVGKVLVYEKTGLINKEHSIELTNIDTSSSTQFVIDSIDLDVDGKITPFSELKHVLDIDPERKTAFLGE